MEILVSHLFSGHFWPWVSKNRDDLAPEGPKTPLNPAKTGLKRQKFGLKSEIKVRILPQIILVFEIGGIEVTAWLFTANMRQKWVKNVQNRAKMAKNWKKLGRYPTSPRYNGSQKIFWLWSLCYIHRGQLDKHRHDCENSNKGWKTGMRAKRAWFGAEPEEHFGLWPCKTPKSFNLTSFQNPPRSRQRVFWR